MGDMLTTESRGRCPIAGRILGPGPICGSALLGQAFEPGH